MTAPSSAASDSKRQRTGAAGFVTARGDSEDEEDDDDQLAMPPLTVEDTDQHLQTLVRGKDKSRHLVKSFSAGFDPQLVIQAISTVAGRLLAVTPGFAQLFQAPENFFVARHCREMVHPKGMATADAVKSMAHDERVSTTSFSFATMLARPNGSIFESRVVMTLLKGLDGLAFQKIFMLDPRSIKEFGFPLFYPPGKTQLQLASGLEHPPKEEEESLDSWILLRNLGQSSPLGRGNITELSSQRDDSSTHSSSSVSPPPNYSELSPSAHGVDFGPGTTEAFSNDGSEDYGGSVGHPSVTPPLTSSYLPPPQTPLVHLHHHLHHHHHHQMQPQQSQPPLPQRLPGSFSGVF